MMTHLDYLEEKEDSSRYRKFSNTVEARQTMG